MAVLMTSTAVAYPGSSVQDPKYQHSSHEVPANSMPDSKIMRPSKKAQWLKVGMLRLLFRFTLALKTTKQGLLCLVQWLLSASIWVWTCVANNHSSRLLHAS